MTAHYSTHGDVAVITLDNPPVNGLGWAVRNAIVQGVQQALADDAVQAIVLTGQGRAFSGGADIREFGKPASMQEPRLPQVIAALEASTKPIVAAVHRVSMGGGLELALGCHYRIVAPDCSVALPEVKLGLLPGAGGTQRLPRALGVAAALQMIVTGEVRKSQDLFALPEQRLFDRLATSNDSLLDEAMAFARSIAAQRPLPLLRERDVADPQASAAIAAQRAQLQRSSKNLQAPFKCVDAVEAATRQPVASGQAYERELFLAQVQSAESRSMRALFLGERAAGKVVAIPAETTARPVQQALLLAASDDALAQANDWAQRLSKAGVQAQAAKVAEAVGTPSAAEQAQLLLLVGAPDAATAAQLPALWAQAPASALLAVLLPAGSQADYDLQALLRDSQRPADCVALQTWGALLEVQRHAATEAAVLASWQALAKALRLTSIHTLAAEGMGAASLGAYFLQQHQQAVQAQGQQDGQALCALGFKAPALPADTPDDGSAQADPQALPQTQAIVQTWVQAAEHALAQGWADKASDLNLLTVRGLGFPVHLGGPLQYAQELQTQQAAASAS